MTKMKRINFESLRERNDYFIDKFIGGMKMEFIKHGDNYLIKNSNGTIVSPEEKLKLERRELALKDVESNKCQQDTTKAISEINKKIKKAKKVVKEEEAKKEDIEVADTIEETKTTL